MIIVVVRTENEMAEIAIYDDTKQLAQRSWHAHRELAETLHSRIVDVLMQANVRLHQIEGMVVYKGPGSFTGLRIGISVINALAYALGIPVVGTTDDAWIESGIERLMNGENDDRVSPEYGAEPNVTKPKH